MPQFTAAIFYGLYVNATYTLKNFLKYHGIFIRGSENVIVLYK